MGIEIEKKFLLTNSSWEKSVSNSYTIQQGYLSSVAERTVRVRIIDDNAFITIKSKSINISRQEFEYEIPLEDAIDLLKLCEKPLINKTRNIVIHNSHKWEIDVFKDENIGLTIAEIELSDEKEIVELPSWIGEEVSHQNKYFNSSLIKLPFTKW